jgi:hypothetical protein
VSLPVLRRKGGEITCSGPSRPTHWTNYTQHQVAEDNRIHEDCTALDLQPSSGVREIRKESDVESVMPKYQKPPKHGLKITVSELYIMKPERVRSQSLLARSVVFAYSP